MTEKEPTSTHRRIHRLNTALIVAAATSIAATALLAAGSSARTSAPSPKPTIVLVHGAWADASSWNGVITRLERDGYQTVAVSNQLRSLEREDGVTHTHYRVAR